MVTSSRLHPRVEWLVASDLNQYDITSGVPTAEELDEAYAYAVANNCVVTLRWTACNGYAGPCFTEIHAGTDLTALKNKLARSWFAV